MPFFLTPGTAGSVHIGRPGFLLTQLNLANNIALPSWMTFDRATSTLNYKVPIDFDGSLNLNFGAFVDTTPEAFRALPFQIVNPSGFGGAYLLEPIVDIFRRVHSDILVSGRLFVDPVAGNDQNAGTIGAPLKTIGAALASHQASEVVLAAGTYTENIDFRDPSIAKILTSSGPVTFIVAGPDLSDLTWTNVGEGLWQATLSGPSLNTILSNITNDSEGFDARLVNFSTMAALQASSSGWMLVGDQLVIKTAGGQTFSSFLNEYDALYSGNFLIYGANLAMNGDFNLRGISVSAFANGAEQAEFWAHGITSFRSPGLAFIGLGGSLILENSRVHASVFDGLNANILGSADSLLVDVNFRASATGDFASFSEPQNGTSQGSSAHSGVDHISLASTIDYGDGQGIADVYSGQSWILDLTVSNSRAHPTLRTAITAVGPDRTVYVDGVFGDASLIAGTLEAHSGATIIASEVTGSIVHDANSQIILTTSSAGQSVWQDTVADSGAAGALLRGTSASDTLISSTQPVRLAGGQGDDFYYVYVQSARVIEHENEGYDRLYAAVDYRLDDFAAIELFSTNDHAGHAPLALTGSFRSDLIFGNAGDNIIDGGKGADTLYGQEGNDSYFVDTWGDFVRERTNEGRDRVYASGDYSLAPGQEIEILSTSFNAGIEPILLIGNEFDNLIFGNAGNNTLVGGGGTDSLYGGRGDDRYYVDSATDFVREYAQEGFDRVYSSESFSLGAGQEIELLSTFDPVGNSAIDLRGNEFTQVIYGNAGSNRIAGGGGADFLKGNGGADVFVFDQLPANGNALPYISDFAADDRIALNRSVFSALGQVAGGVLDASNFVIGNTALDQNDHILYDARLGTLAYDPDGAGGQDAVIFALVNASAPITAAHIEIFG